MLFLKRSELIFGRMTVLSHPPQEHLHELVTGSGLGLEQEAQQQRMTFAGLRQVAQIADLHPRGLGGELADLGVGDTFEERFGIDDCVQLCQAIGPLPDVVQGRRSWGFLEPREGRDVLAWRNFEQHVEDRGQLMGEGPR